MDNWSIPAECFICTKTIPPQQQQHESESVRAIRNVNFLGHILDFPKLGTQFDIKSVKSDDICYCKPCSEDLKMLQLMLQNLENLEKQVLDRKYEIELRMKENYEMQHENKSGKLQNPITKLRNQVSEELNKCSMLSMVEKIKSKQVGLKTRPEIPESGFRKKIMEIGNGSTTIEPADLSENENDDQSNQSFDIEPQYHSNSESQSNSFSENFSQSQTFQEMSDDPLSWELEDADAEIFQEEEEEDEDTGEILICEQDEEIQANGGNDEEDGGGMSIPDFLLGELVAPQIQSVPEVEENTKVIFTARNARVSHTIQPQPSRNTNANAGNSSRMRTSYVCGICGLTFPNYNKLTEHDKLHVSVPSYSDTVTVPLESNLRKRLEIPKAKTFPTHAPATRSNIGSSLNQLNRNGPSQNAEKKFSASVNSNSSANANGRVVRRAPASSGTATGNSSPTSEGEIRCGICSVECVSRSRLKLHMASHSEVRNFKCPLCQKRFKHKDALKAHIKTHSAVKSFVCSFCSGRFKYAKNLRAHIRYTHSHPSLNY